MKSWFELTDKEKIHRLSQVVFSQYKRINKLEEHFPVEALPGYEVINISMSMEAEDHWLGAYKGCVINHGIPLQAEPEDAENG